MKETYVSTLPMDPKRSSEFFLFTTPLVANLVSNATHQSLILPINQIGETNLNIFPYREGLKALGITNYLMAYDNDTEFLDFVRVETNKQIKRGALYLSKEIIFRCECGAVEILASATDNIQKRTNGKVFQIDNDHIKCKKCQTEAFPLEYTCLLSRSQSEHISSLNVQPKYFRPQVEKFLSQYFSHDQLISRQRSTAVKVDLDEHTINLDNDYVWLNYGKFLRETGINTRVVVISNHSLRKGAIYTELLSDGNTDLLITPYVSFRDKNPKFSIDELKKIYSSRELRTFLVTHLNWQVQNYFADEMLLVWSRKVTCDLPRTKSSLVELDGITEIIKGHNLKMAMIARSKGRPLTDDQNVLLSLL